VRLARRFGPAVAVLGVLSAISLAIRPEDRGPEAWWFGDWTRSEYSRNAWALFAVSDSSRLFRDAWEIADVRERARGVGEAPPGLSIRTDATVPEALARAVHAHVRREFAAVAPTPQYAVVVLISMDSIPRTSHLIGVVRPATAAAPCVVQVRIPVLIATRAWLDADEQLLGACGLYARFGAVGAGMERWLERSGMRTAALHTAEGLGAPRRDWSPGLPELARDPSRVACLAGRLDHCRVVLDGDARALTGAVVAARPGSAAARRLTNSHRVGVFVGDGGGGTGDLLAALRATLGDDRFAMLWSSDEDPYATFAANERRPLEAMLATALRTSYGERPAAADSGGRRGSSGSG